MNDLGYESDLDRLTFNSGVGTRKFLEIWHHEVSLPCYFLVMEKLTGG
jgi:hypothetical protein